MANDFVLVRTHISGKDHLYCGQLQGGLSAEVELSEVYRLSVPAETLAPNKFEINMDSLNDIALHGSADELYVSEPVTRMYLREVVEIIEVSDEALEVIRKRGRAEE